MAAPAAPRKTRPRSPTLDAANEVIRSLGPKGGGGDPPQEDAGADSDLEIIAEPPAGRTPAEPTPPAGSVPALCPAWKRGHCTVEDWCSKQHPRPGPDDGALPAVGQTAASAALRYKVAQGWNLDETARGSVIIQEAVDRVADMGQTEVALHIRGRHGGPAEGIVVEPTGMVLVLAADTVRGVLHASRMRRARPQWTIHTYDFSSCFFRKFKKSTKRGFSREMTYSFGFYCPKIVGGGAPTRIVSKNIKNPEIWPILWYFCLLPAGPAEQCCTPVRLPMEDFRQKFQFSLESLAPK